MKTIYQAFVFVGMSVFFLGGCASTSPPSDNSPQSSPYYSSAYGVVEAIDSIPTESGGSGIGVGTVIGGVVGGVLGHQVGGGTGKTVATAAGAVGGAVVGHEIEKRRASGASSTYLVRIRLDDGGYKSIEQAKIGDMRVGDRVRIENGRVIRY